MYVCGHQLNTVVKCVHQTRVNGKKDSIPLEDYVIRDNLRPLLGLESCLSLVLITLNGKVQQKGLSIKEVQQKPTILNEFQDEFQGGFSHDPEKISAIHNMLTPSCKQDLQRFTRQ